MSAPEPLIRDRVSHGRTRQPLVPIRRFLRREAASSVARPERSTLWIGALVLAILALALAPLDLLLPKAPLAGRIRDAASGEPIAGARIGVGRSATQTGADGRFAVDRVSPTDRLQVEADGYQSAQASILARRQVDVELAPRAFAIDARDAETDEPVADVIVQAAGARAHSVTTGQFRIEPARESLQVTVSSPNYRDALVTFRGEPSLRVHLQPRILGAVIDGTTGRPIQGAFVSDGDLAMTTDTNGRFELERRPRGPLRVLAPGFKRLDLDASQSRLVVASLEPFTARAVYLTYFGVGDRALRENVLALTEKTEVNAVVIDVKGDRGRLSYRSSVPLAEAIGANAETTVPNIDELLQQLKQRNVYTIARIVVFRDELLAKNGEPAGVDVAVRERLTDKPWTDAEGRFWVDPFRPEVWEYNVQLAREAALKGFDEVQFDDVRFPVEQAGGGMLANQARYSRPWHTARDRVDAVSDFLRRAHDEVRVSGAFVSATVMGYVAWNDGDNGVGHELTTLASLVDYLCPTFYPSSFRAGVPGFINYPQVIQRPHDVAFESVRRARARTLEQGAVVRPWLQYFDDYSWQTGRAYRTAEIDAQRTGAMAAGANGWMMWDPSNKYARGGLGVRP
ncbi:MAG: carboxypeptidase regulatory-like domain-containing protein [Chloroflexi bacterium]|nr:carboxypeptidase regulatory-like domain-containing protein [Chloroflexota bacterium]